jgi:hypothetical protein
VQAVVVEVLCVIGWRADCSRGSDGLIFGLGSKEDGMGNSKTVHKEGCN